MRELTLVKDDAEDGEHFWVQYLNEFTFNVFVKNQQGSMVPIILDAECHLSEIVPDEVIVRTDHHTYLVDYYMDTRENNIVTQLDYEGDPLPIKVKVTKIERHDEEEVSK